MFDSHYYVNPKIMLEIKLTKNRIALIDDDDLDKVKNYMWSVNQSGGKCYARTLIRSDERPNKLKSLFLHHLILGRPSKGKRIFFKDGNALNCQKSNIDFITCSEASHYYYKKKKPNKNANENFKGVLIQYVARIKHNNKIIVLGQFGNEKDAANAYNKKALELFGSKAVLNKL